LAADFPIQARFDDASIFETNELLVLVSGRGDRTADHAEYLVEAVVRRPIAVAPVPAYLFGGTGKNTGSAGMLRPESYRRELGAGFLQPGGRPAAWWDNVPNHALFDPKTYREWVRYAGRYPLWMSILRRREAERCADHSGASLARDEPPRPEIPGVEGDENIPF
jgi:hypothetical protein